MVETMRNFATQPAFLNNVMHPQDAKEVTQSLIDFQQGTSRRLYFAIRGCNSGNFVHALKSMFGPRIKFKKFFDETTDDVPGIYCYFGYDGKEEFIPEELSHIYPIRFLPNGVKLSEFAKLKEDIC